MTRIMIFIDGSNLYWAFKTWLKHNRQPPSACNIPKLVAVLTENRELVRAYFFCSIKPPKNGDNVETNKTITFLNTLKLSGIETSAYPLKIRKRTFKCPQCHRFWAEPVTVEKGVDVALVTKLLSLGFKGGYDTAILVSGDADYVEAVRQVKDNGKRVEVAAFKESAAKALVDCADRFIPLDDLVEQFKMQTQRRKQR